MNATASIRPLILPLLPLAMAACAAHRSDPVVPAAPTDPPPITAESVRPHVLALADDDMEGRGAGYPGEVRASGYIARRLQDAGLDTSVREFRFLPRDPEPGAARLTSRNVLAMLPGSDLGLRDQVIVVGAHHDGQGCAGQADGGRYPAEPPPAPNDPPDTVWNSADDNASSVAALLEIARTMAALPRRPRRAILFATFGAEEHALNGSARLATRGSGARRGGRSWVAMVNIEKIGRVPDQPLIMAGCSTSPAWAQILEQANKLTGRDVECVLPELVGDTDHYPFAALGTLAIVLGTAHEQDTHRPGDEASRLDYDALALRANYIREFVSILANRNDAPGFAPDTQRGSGMLTLVASAAERDALFGAAARDPGALPRGALKVGVVLPALPAAVAGLREGDFIIEMEGQPLAAAPEDRAHEAVLQDKGALELTVRRGAGGRKVRVVRQK